MLYILCIICTKVKFVKKKNDKKCMLFNYIYSVFLLYNVEKDVINICDSIFSYDAINVE
jgi:hypothetical protein